MMTTAIDFEKWWNNDVQLKRKRKKKKMMMMMIKEWDDERKVLHLAIGVEEVVKVT
jgi:hypothetical protein